MDGVSRDFGIQNKRSTSEKDRNDGTQIESQHEVIRMASKTYLPCSELEKDVCHCQREIEPD